MIKRILVLTVALGASGCAVGPDYQAPAMSAPEAFNATHSRGDFLAEEERFWSGFGDPILAQLIAQTLVGNNSLQSAVANYDKALALLGGAKRDQWPSVTLNASVSDQHLAAIERSPAVTGPKQIDVYQAGIAANWELDLFGRLRRATEAQQAELMASAEDVAALQVSLVGELASRYFQLRGLQQQLRVAEKNVALQQQSLAIVTARVQAGRGTEFDQVRAQAQLDRTRAELPVLQADIKTAMHQIAVLTGNPPASLIAQLTPIHALISDTPVIPVDTPGEVLRRRPDILAAERRLAAATARIGVASADLFPRFTLSGLLGSIAQDSSNLFTGQAEYRRVALGVDWTFLDRAKVKARIDAADADSRAALASYQQTVLSVLEEVESRLVQYQQQKLRTQRLQQAVNAAERAAELAQERYQRGYIDYFEVLAAERELSDTRATVVQSMTATTLAMINIYRSLAGAPTEVTPPHST